MEKELVARAKKGDKTAFARLYSMYKDKLYRYAYYKLGSVEDAQDAVCDTVLYAYEQIGDLRKSSAFSSWIFKIHYATCTKYIKKQIELKGQSDVDEQVNIKSESEVTSLSLELRESLAILDEQEREVVLLSVVAGFNSKEISKLIGLTDGSVRSKLSRSLAKMRAFLE